jgi:transposase-like protein
MSRNETSIPDPEVVPTAKRRRFTTQEKVRILKEADACTEPGELGALLRREGIYSSYLSRWRRARDRGELQALSPKRRGPKSAADSGLTKELAKLQRENEQLRGRLAQAEAIIEAQKKLSELLGLNPRETGNDEGR